MIVSFEHNVSHRVVQSNLHAHQSGEVCPWILELTGRVNVRLCIFTLKLTQWRLFLFWRLLIPAMCMNGAP